MRAKSKFEYCNVSILENMHVAKFFDMCQKNRSNDIFSQINDKK